MEIKLCSKCKEEKPLTEYYKNQNQCKDCKRAYNREWVKTPKGKNTVSKAVIKWRSKRQGVYGIFVDQTCYYVGESSGLDGRISQHKTYIKNPQSAKPMFFPLYNSLQDKDYEIKILEETPNHKEKEKVWIEYLAPLYNA